jgi:hypothetical protein
MHLDDEQVQRLLDRELPQAAERPAREHLDGCAQCRARLAEAEREEAETAELLRLLDHPAPRISAQAVAAAALRRTAHFRWAAGILLAAGLAGVAYAAPGSPLRAWIGALVERVGGSPKPQAPAPPRAPAGEPVSAGVAVSAGRRLVVSFDSAQVTGEALVTLSDQAAEVTVRAPGDAVGFTSDPELLTIHNRGSGASYRIEIPGNAPWVEIRVAGTRILLKEGERITAVAPVEPSGRAYRLPLWR